MNLSCFLAPSPEAKDASLLFHHDNDNRNLWERTNQSDPLTTCSYPNATDSGCHVCTKDEKVYAFCRTLLDKVGLVMEGSGPGSSISLEEIDCPVFLPVSPKQEPDFPTGLVIAVVIFLFLLFLIIVGFVLYCKRRNKHDSVPSKEEEEDDAAAATAESAVDD